MSHGLATPNGVLSYTAASRQQRTTMMSCTRSGRRFKPQELDQPSSLPVAAPQTPCRRLHYDNHGDAPSSAGNSSKRRRTTLNSPRGPHEQQACASPSSADAPMGSEQLAIAAKPPLQLQALCLERLPLCSQPDAAALQRLEAAAAAAAAAHPHLASLSISFREVGSFLMDLSDREADLGSVATNRQLAAVLRGAFRAQQLALSISTPCTLAPLLPFCHRLTALNIGACMHLPGSLGLIAPKLQQLRHLELFNDEKQLTSDSRPDFFNGYDVAALAGCHVLESLTLHVKNSEVMGAVARLTQLKALDMRDCAYCGGTQVTPADIASLSALTGLTSLTTSAFYNQQYKIPTHASTFGAWGHVFDRLAKLQLLTFRVPGWCVNDAVVGAVGHARGINRLRLLLEKKVDVSEVHGVVTVEGAQQGLSHIGAVEVEVAAHVFWSCGAIRCLQALQHVQVLRHGQRLSWDDCPCQVCVRSLFR